MKTPHSTSTPLVTGVLSVALLLNSGCATLQQVAQDTVKAVTDVSVLSGVATGAAAFFGAKHFKADNGQAVLVALIASTTVFFVVKAATSEEKREAEARARELRAQRDRENAASPKNPEATDKTQSSERYVALELPPAAPASPSDAGTSQPASTQPPSSSPTGASTGTGSSINPPSSSRTRFVIVDVTSGEVIGDEVYEAASRPRNEEKIKVGEKELTYVQYSPGSPTPTP